MPAINSSQQRSGLRKRRVVVYDGRRCCVSSNVGGDSLLVDPDRSLPCPASARSRRRRVLVIGGILLAVVGAGLLGRRFAIRWTLQAAQGQLDIGAIGPAEALLDRAALLDADDDRIDVLRAHGFRQLGNQAEERTALAAAEQKGTSLAELTRERSLSAVLWGEARQVTAGDFTRLVEAGASPREAITAIVQGMLAQQQTAAALTFLEDSSARLNDPAQLSYLRGLCHWSTGDIPAAQSEFEQVLTNRPEHEPARMSLGKLLEQEEQLSEALPHYAQLATAAPHRDSARVDLSRVLRKLGRGSDARAVLPDADASQLTQDMALELAERAYEAGEYAAALGWYRFVDLDGPYPAETLRTAASTMALGGAQDLAQQLFTRVDDAQRDFRHGSELQRRLRMDSRDEVASGELVHLQHQQSLAQTKAADSAHQTPGGAGLYQQQCAACHGENGDGHGRAARFLFPRPRNLRADRQRLVSTQNGVPTLEDIERVIQRGIPGTSMPSFADLSATERRQLALEVQQFRRAGLREQIEEQLRDSGDELGNEDVGQIVTNQATPGEVLTVPTLESATANTLARGAALFVEAGCAKCHGSDGTGASDVLLFDDDGRPSVPRDLVHDFMKGGNEPESIYQRIRLGMPGTSHPSSAGLDHEALSALVHYCQSLWEEPTVRLTNHQRATHRPPPIAGLTRR